MKKLAALLLWAPFALGQGLGDISTLGPNPGCYRGSAIAVTMLPLEPGYDTKTATDACFSYCSQFVSQTNVRANVIDKSNRRKSRVQCKCFDGSDTVNPVTLTCTDVVLGTDNAGTPGSTNNGKSKGKGKGKGKGRGNGKGRAKQCRKCTAVKCQDGSTTTCSSTAPLTPTPGVEGTN